MRSKDSECCATEGKVDRGNLPEGMTQFHTDRVAQQWPDVVLLDKVTSALNPSTARAVEEMVLELDVS